MSYENVPCASPDTEGQEEPAPSLYGVDEDKIRSVKNLCAPSRLAETANIEDHVIMNEEEIAQVRDSVSLIGGRRDVYVDNRDARTATMTDKKDGETHEGIKHLDDRKSSGSYQHDRWIDLNLPTPKRGHAYTKESRANTAEVPMNEFADRGTSVIKRTVQDMSPDHENKSIRKIGLGGKEEYMNLHCSEKLDSSGVRIDPTRAYYYHYNSHEDFKAKPPVRDNKDDYDSDNERPSRDLQKNQDQRAVPQIYYMQHPNSVAMSQAGKLAPQALGVLPAHAHLIRNRFGDNGPIHPGQRAEYANRPEQQVPVANSPGDSTEHNNTRYGGMPAHLKNAAGIHYVDRPGFVPQGFAVLPGIGPVTVVDGLYYTGIPTGHESTHYENFGAVSTFVPQGDVAAIHQQNRAVATSTASTSAGAESSSSHSQDNPTNNTPYISEHHINPSSPPANTEEAKPSSPSIKSERDSPVPSTLDDQDKKSQIAKQKGRPKPLPGSKPEIKCEQCGKIFGSSSALAKHKLTHSDERRYVCSICSKGFKRQDHLNGHMVTHRDKKPYECSYQDCDKSYCDMRSLRRHLENHHANGQGSNEGGSRTSSPALTTSEPSANSSTAQASESATGRVVIKPGRGRPPKDRSIKLESHENTDCESGKNSGTSTPGSTHEVVVVRDQATMVSSRERNSDSFSSTGSEDVVHTQVEKPGEVIQVAGGDDTKPHTAIDLLKQAAERAQEQRDKQNIERFPQQQQYVMYPDGSISQYPQWYQTSVFAGQDPRFNVYQYPQLFAQQVYHHGGAQMIVNNPNMQRHPMAARIYTDGTDTHGDKTQQQVVVPPKQVTQRSPSVEYPPTSSAQGPFMRQPVQQVAGTPTDPTAIALATAKDNGQQLFTREGYYGVHPSGTQWQQVRYDEPSSQYNNSENTVPTMGNVKTSFAHVRSPSNSSTSSDVDADNNEHYQRGIHYAPGIRHDGHDSLSRKPAHTIDSSYPKKSDTSFHHVPEGNSPLDEKKTINDKEGMAVKDDGVFRNPGEIVTPRRKQRPKPEPLKIPASVSTAYHTSHSHPVPGSPPYTPPPMLSPRSFYSHVNAAGNLTPRSSLPQLPMTPSRLLLSSRSCRSSVDAGEEEGVVFPEPKINVGLYFQAKIPDRVLPRELAKNDIHKATICWNPMDEKKKGRTQEIEAFLEMSSSCAIFGGSSNKEYALHILQRTKGNIKDAVKLILSKKHVTPSSDPMHDYRYEGSVKWSARERQTFRNAFRVKNKDFIDLQKEINTKRVADCVEFYYLWKANNPEAVRGRTRYVDSNSEDDYEDDTGSETNSNPSLFECDFPQCSAKFVSRQALNGHIRVHGGSFMKPSEPRKRRTPATTSTHDSETVVVVKRPRKPYVPAPMPQPLVEGGPLPEYACKVCGRIFHKIKSRSAHMKTHVKRPDDDHKHDIQR